MINVYKSLVVCTYFIGEKIQPFHKIFACKYPRRYALPRKILWKRELKNAIKKVRELKTQRYERIFVIRYSVGLSDAFVLLFPILQHFYLRHWNCYHIQKKTVTCLFVFSVKKKQPLSRIFHAIVFDLSFFFFRVPFYI